MALWLKITNMDVFEERLKAFFMKSQHSLYDVCMDVGIDPSNAKKILYSERSTTFEKRLELARKISRSSLISLPYGVMARWLAESYLPEEVLGPIDISLKNLGNY